MQSYKGWDVHSYTKDIQSVLDTLLEEIGKVLGYPWSCKNEFSDHRFQDCCQTVKKILQTHYPNHPQKGDILLCISKFEHYWNSTNHGWNDPDLKNVNVAWLFCCATAATCSTAEEDLVTDLFLETLADIGGTCIQGDSHRLLSFLAAVLGDKKFNDNKVQPV